jgi:alpha-aminoadipate/glutamate carrier protein LysW
MVLCPECETDLDLDPEEVDEGEVVSCVECGSDFEIVTTHPIELKPVGDDDDEEEAKDEDENGDY